MAGSAFDRVNGVLIDRVIIVDSTGSVITEDNPLQVLLAKNPVTTDLRLRISCNPTGYDIIEGNISGRTPVTKMGFNGDIDAAEEDLWAVGGTYVFPAAEQQMEVVSSSGDDAAAGTGARTVRIWYLDSDFVQHEDTVTLNGVTAVPTNATDIFRVNAFRVETAGTGNVAAGNIDIRNLADTPIYSRIPATLTSARNAIYTVPKDNTLYITQVTYSIGSSVGGVFGTFSLRANYCEFTGSICDLFYPYSEIGVEQGPFTISYVIPMKFTEGVDIRVLAKGDNAAANGTATVQWRGWLESTA